MSIVTIQSDGLTAAISSHGAELQSLRSADGVEYLWQGDPAFWTGRAPILFPVAGGLREDRYEIDGCSYPMPKHGIVRKQEWQLISQRADAAEFAISEQAPGFPFHYVLRVRYTVIGRMLKIENDVENLDTRAFWFSLGSHEAYATPEGIEAYELLFDQSEVFDDYVLKGNLVERTPVRMYENTRRFPLRYQDYAVDALVFPHLKSRGVVLQSKLHDRRLRVDYPDCGVLMLWTKPGAGYICIEPWRNAPDFVDADFDISKKPGFISLQAGARSVTTHTITLL